MSPFNFQSIQSLEISAQDNPVIDVRDGNLVITAERGQEKIMITTPLHGAVPKVSTTKVKTPKSKKPHALLGRNLHQGSENGMSKLNESVVKEIRTLTADKTFVKSYKNPSAMYSELASLYKVSPWAIKNVVDNSSWKHVTI